MGTGGWPSWPAATWMFCSLIAVTTSEEVRLRNDIFCGIEPDPHAVVALADVGDVAHAVQPGSSSRTGSSRSC